MRHSLRLWAGLMLLMSFLSACALGDQGPTPFPVTLPPAPTLVFSGECTLTADLEDWLETTYFLKEDFALVVSGLPNQTRAEIQDDFNRMVDLRNALNGLETPDCAVQAQSALSDAMTAAITGVQRYINGEVGDVNGIVESANAQLTAFSNLHSELQARFEAAIGGQ